MDAFWIGAITGPIGAVTGILALGWNIYLGRRDRAGVQFKMTIGMNVAMAGAPKLGGAHAAGKYSAFARVVNVGRRPITLETIGFDFPDGHEAVIPLIGLPAELAEGKAFGWPIELKELRKALAPYKARPPKHAWIQDARGKKHYTRIQQHLLEAITGKGEWGKVPD